MLVNFRSYPYKTTVSFTCETCGKPGRKRTFKSECTVNPFNCHPDGTPRTPQEVAAQSREQARAEAARFLHYPVCSTCEDKVSYRERKGLTALRQSIQEPDK